MFIPTELVVFDYYRRCEVTLPAAKAQALIDGGHASLVRGNTTGGTSKLSHLGPNQKNLYDCVVYKPGTLATILATLCSRRGGDVNVAAELGLEADLKPATRHDLLLTKTEQLLSLMIDEGIIKREAGIVDGIPHNDRAHSTYKAS